MKRKPFSSLLLDNVNFRRFWAGQFVSTLGDSFTGIALIWVLMDLTNSTLSRGITLALSVIPTVVLSPFVGAWVDRMRRKQLMIYSDLARFLLDVILIIVISTSTLKAWHIHAFSFLQALVRVLYLPCLTAFVPMLVKREELFSSNGFQELARHVSMVIGPILAGKAMTLLGARAVIAIDAVTFLLSALLTNAIRLSEQPMQKQQSVSTGEQLRLGWLYVRRNPWILYLTGSLLLVNMGSAIVGVIMPFIARNKLNLDEMGYGMISSALSLGSVAASLLLSALPIKGSRKLLLVGSIAAAGFLTAGMAASSGLYPLLLVNLLIGLFSPVMMVSTNSIYQETIPHEYMGRVAAFRRTIGTSLQPVTFLLTGLIGDRLGYGTSLMIAALLTTSAAVIIWMKAHVPTTLASEQASA